MNKKCIKLKINSIKNSGQFHMELPTYFMILKCRSVDFKEQQGGNNHEK